MAIDIENQQKPNDKPGEIPLTMLGIDHRRTALADRETLALGQDQPSQLEAALARLPGAAGAVVVATCNRVECWVGGFLDKTALAQALAAVTGVKVENILAWAEYRQGALAVRHLFRVASGLESLVIGEPHILGQVRTAYGRCQGRSGVSPVLHQSFQRGLACGKEVRARTALGQLRESTASVGVDLARQVLGDLTELSVLVVGAGEIAEEVLAALTRGGVRRPTIINRSPDKAERLASLFAGVTAPWQSLAEQVGQHQVVITSTASPDPIITPLMVKPALRQARRGLLFLDLSVPRNVAPDVAELDGVYLYNIDDLDQVVATHRDLGGQEVLQAEALVNTRVQAALPGLLPQGGNLQAQIQAWFDRLVASEWEAVKNRVPPGQEDLVRQAIHHTAARCQHHIMEYVRREPSPQRSEAMRTMLGLDQG